MHFYNHGTLWLACVLLSGDLCAQDAPSDQGVSLPIAVQDESSGSDDSLSSTNQGNNASRADHRFRDATVVERASLVSLVDLDHGHRHQAVFKVSSPEAIVLRFKLPEAARDVELSVYGMKMPPEFSGSELRVALSPLALTKVQINYTSESMQAPSILDDVSVLASTRQIFGSEDIGVDSESATFVSSLMRPWSSTADVMLTMDESLNWEIVSRRLLGSEVLRNIVMPREAVAAVVDSHAIDERWKVRPADAVCKLRERLTVTGKADGMAVHFQLEKGRDLVHDIAKAYQNHRIALAEEVRNHALRLAQPQLAEQEARTEAARQRMLDMAERYEIDENRRGGDDDQGGEPRLELTADQIEDAPLAPAEGDILSSLTVPHDFMPMYTQAQSGPWPAFDYKIENLTAESRTAWLIMGTSILVVVLTICLYRRRFRYLGLLRQ